MKRTTRKGKLHQKSKKTRQNRRKIPKKVGGSIIKETRYVRIQAPNGTNWPGIEIDTFVDGSYNDILNYYLSQNVQKVETGIHNIMKNENIYSMGLHRSYFQRLVWLGEDVPKRLSPPKEKTEEDKIEEIKELIQIQNDPNYASELEIWRKWYDTYITTIPQTAEEIIDILNKNVKDLSKVEKILLEIAKLTRISWFKNHKMNEKMIPLENPIEITKHIPKK
jgi:hypothetical protein